jgi:trimeric autotransporter adhesin
MKKITFSLFFTFSFSLFTFSQTINTVAGKYSLGYGYSGDGGQASTAQMHFPTGLVFDKAGNMFISDQVNNVVREVTKSTGIISTIAGNYAYGSGYSGDGGQATNAELFGPLAMAIDSTGNIYIADNVNSVIRKVDMTTGIISTVAGIGNVLNYSGDGGQATAAELSRPTGMALDKDGNLYIADCLNSVIRKVDHSTGIINTIVGIPKKAGYNGDGGPATSAELQYPQNLTLDAKGNMYIADASNNVVRYVDASTGNISTIAGNGKPGYYGDGGQATNAELDNLTDVTLDANGNVYIGDFNNQVVRLLTVSTGVITTFAGNNVQGFYGDGGPATAAEFFEPIGGAFDKSGNFYVVDESNNVIREITGITTGTEPLAVENNRVSIRIFPNPANNSVSLVYTLPNSETRGTISLYNSLGQLVKFEFVSANSGMVSEDLSAISAGIYYYSLVTENGAKTTSKLIISK